MTFVELESVTQFLISNAVEPTTTFLVTPPAEKMKRNGISKAMSPLLTLGVGGAGEVEKYVQHRSALEVDFPERLKSGFMKEYLALRSQGLLGDGLFAGLIQFAQGGKGDWSAKRRDSRCSATFS